MGKAETPKIQIHRGYARSVPRWSAKEQEKALIAAGCLEGKVYVEGRGPESFAAIEKAAREGENIGLSGGLRVLGDSRKAIVAAVEAITNKGAVWLDVENGDQSDRHGVRMLNRALAVLHGELSIGNRAAIIGSLGGEARGEAIRKARMPKEEARLIWMDQRISTAEAVRRMGKGWSKPTARRAFGPSGRPLGPFKEERAAKEPPPVHPSVARVRNVGNIYFLLARKGNAVKIGFTERGMSRVNGVQTAHHETLKLVAFIRGNRAREKVLHKKFAKYHIRGEWFHFRGAVKAFVDQTKAKK